MLKELLYQYYYIDKQIKDLETEYLMEFSNDEELRYKNLIELAKWKKKLAILIEAINNNENVTDAEIDNKIDEIMQEYHEDYLEMIEDNKKAVDKAYTDLETKEKCQKVFNEIIDLVHPDLHPNINYSYANMLISQAELYYFNNDLYSLKEIRSDAREFSDEIVEDQSLAKDVKQRINKLKSTKGYSYKEILESKEKKDNRHKELQNDILMFQSYTKDIESEYYRLLKNMKAPN